MGGGGRAAADTRLSFAGGGGGILQRLITLKGHFGVFTERGSRTDWPPRQQQAVNSLQLVTARSSSLGLLW